MFGGGGLNPRKMKQMMEQMGIDLHELDAEQVIIRTVDGEELVFDAPDVTRMDARGQQTYQVIGEPETRDVSAGETETPDSAESATDTGGDGDGDGDIPDEDVELVAQRADVSESQAREALAAVNGDLAAAIDRLE